jgi:amidophosphoribosyltransferase
MCGIIGIVATQDVAGALYDGLTVLQHRGQDAAGIATADGAHIHARKGNGLVRDVFDEDAMRALRGRVGVAHCRYPTAGSEGSDEAQPFYVNSPYGIALVHNGNLINTETLRREVFEQDRRNVNTDSDSEVLLNVFAHELDTQKVLTPDAALRAIEGVNRRARGGYAVITAVLGLGIVAFRDPNGIRPLVLGKRTTAGGDEYAVASESVALDILGFERLRDVAPGEGVVVTARGELFTRQCAQPQQHAPCIFEYVYFARGPEARREDPAAASGSRYRRGDSDPRYVARRRARDRQRARREVPRGVHQEPLCRPHLHHARAGRTREVGEAQAQPDSARIP